MDKPFNPIEIYGAMGALEDMCYQMYIADWKRRNITPQIEINSCRAFLLRCLQDCKENGKLSYKDEFGDADYQSFIEEFGYPNKEPCYKNMGEFMRDEFRDKSYMHFLLDNEELEQFYDGAISEYEKVWNGEYDSEEPEASYP